MSASELATAGLNTLAICLLCMVLAVPVGTLLAILLVRTNVYGRQFGWIAICSQLAVPLYVFAGGWSAGFGLQGWLNLADRWGAWGAAAMQSPLALLLAVACVHALAAIPWVCLIISLGLLWRDRSQEEAALLEGGWPRALRSVTLPKLRPWIMASCVWCAVPVLTEMVVTNLYQVPTLAEQVYLDASRGRVRPLTSLSCVLLCMLPLCLAAGLVIRTMPAWGAVNVRADHFPAERIELQAWRWPLSLALWKLLFLLVGLPILNLVVKAGWHPYTDALGVTRYGWRAMRLVTTAQESLFALYPRIHLVVGIGCGCQWKCPVAGGRLDLADAIHRQTEVVRAWSDANSGCRARATSGDVIDFSAQPRLSRLVRTAVRHQLGCRHPGTAIPIVTLGLAVDQCHHRCRASAGMGIGGSRWTKFPQQAGLYPVAAVWAATERGFSIVDGPQYR